MASDDAALVARAREGDLDALSDLVTRYRDAAFGLAYHCLGDFEEAQDATQEALLRAYANLGRLREPARFAPWLRRITTRVCVEMLRRRGDRALYLEEHPEVTAGGPNEVEQLASRMAVREAFSRLSEKARLTVTLYYINGYSHGEIAGFLEVPVTTVRTRLRRAKLQLRKEMIAMVSDVLQQGRPDEAFLRKVVEEAVRRGREAHLAHAGGEALRHYDEGLEAAAQLPPGPEQQRLRMDLLWGKGQASEFSPGWAAAVGLYEQALALAEELGDRQQQAAMLAHLGVTCSNLGKTEQARAYYERARAAYRELGDRAGEGICLFWLASQHLHAKQPAPAKALLEQAVALLAGSGAWSALGMCRAALNLVEAVPEERYPSLAEYSASCVVLEQAEGTLAFAGEPGIGGSELADAPAVFSIGDVFYQVGWLRRFLDASVPVGGSWSGDSFSYSYQPLKSRLVVKSDRERVTVPAGSFEGCLLTEVITQESGLPDPAEPRKHDLNRQYLCGTRRVWYAPGVGLVELSVERGDGLHALIQLQEHGITGGGGYLPLAVGNCWTYVWADAPETFAASEVYVVIARQENRWYLAHHSFVYPRQDL